MKCEVSKSDNLCHCTMDLDELSAVVLGLSARCMLSREPLKLEEHLAHRFGQALAHMLSTPRAAPHMPGPGSPAGKGRPPGTT